MTVRSSGRRAADVHLAMPLALHQHWRGLVERVAGRLREQAAGRVAGLVVIRAELQPPMLRLTHEAGLALQGDIVRRLQRGLRPVDLVLGVEPWEWLAILPDLAAGTSVVLAMLKVQRLLAEPPLRLPGTGTAMRFAFGAAVHPDQGEDAQFLLQSARIAAIAAARHPDAYMLYDTAIEAVDSAGHAQVEELRAALSANTLQLYLQPQVDIASGTCRHAEALLRWRLDDGTAIPAPDAIAMVELGGLRPRFNRWLIQQGVQAIARLEDGGIAIDIGLNLTGNDLLDPELPDLVEQTLALWHVEARRLLLEITETVAVSDTAVVAQTLNRLRGLGVRLAIDDFGTGYAGMSYLRRLPVHEVKIDQSFVRRINDSPQDYEIIASVVTLAHRLGMEIVAEGVESEAVLATLGRLGCERAQGYLFSPALPEAEFVSWWRARQEQS